ncbi:MAG: glycosyltransferase family 1 protein [Clostridiaceae bacterium]|nr:glycosyltransferase family 1 protein [Clostridiaceae bacterium]
MIKPIRILHVLGRLDRGGAETMVMNWYRNIDRTKIQFDFVVHTEEECAYNDEILALGGKIHSIPRYTGSNHIYYKRCWKDLFKKYPEYRIVHGHVRSTASIYLRIAKKAGLIAIAHSHSTSSGKGFSAIIKAFLQYRIRYIADYFFACSETAGKWLFGEKTCEKETFYYLKNAIDTKEFAFKEKVRNRKRKELGIVDKFVVGHVGRFSHSKNHDFLIDIFKEASKDYEDMMLMLVGDGELRAVIEAKVSSLGMKKSVIFAGVRADINELLMAMDVFLFPSLYEGLGIVLIEAQAVGLPCIVADTIPQEAYLTPLLTCAPLEKPAGEWADKILSLKGKHVRIDMSEKIRKAGYDVRENASWLEEFYTRIAG